MHVSNGTVLEFKFANGDIKTGRYHNGMVTFGYFGEEQFGWLLVARNAIKITNVDTGQVLKDRYGRSMFNAADHLGGTDVDFPIVASKPAIRIAKSSTIKSVRSGVDTSATA